jgi:hypothetical protein
MKQRVKRPLTYRPFAALADQVPQDLAGLGYEEPDTIVSSQQNGKRKRDKKDGRRKPTPAAESDSSGERVMATTTNRASSSKKKAGQERERRSSRRSSSEEKSSMSKFASGAADIAVDDVLRPGLRTAAKAGGAVLGYAAVGTVLNKTTGTSLPYLPK